MINNNKPLNPFGDSPFASVWEEAMSNIDFRQCYTPNDDTLYTGMITIDKVGIMAYIYIMKGKITYIDCTINGIQIYKAFDGVDNFITFVNIINKIINLKCNYDN